MLQLPKNKTLWTIVGAAGALAISFVLAQVGLLQMAFLFGAIAFIVVSVFVVRRPFVGLALVFFLLPFERLGAVQLGTTTVRGSQVVSLIMIVAWVWEQLLVGKFKLRKNPLVLPIFVFLLVNVLSLFNALNLSRGVTVLAFTVFVVTVSLVTTQLITTKRQVMILVNILLTVAALVSIFGLFQFVGDLVGLPISLTGLDPLYQKAIFGFPRIQATSLEPLYFADFLLLPLGLVLAKLFAEDQEGKTWLWVSLTTLFLINLVLTVSRGAYFGAIAMLGILVLYNFRRVFSKRNLLIYGAIIGVAFIAVVALLGLSANAQKTLTNYVNHVLNITTGASFADRAGTIDTALRAWKGHPFFGIGTGNFGPAIAVNPLLAPERGWLIVNNETIEILTEVGVVGLAVFVWAMWTILSRLFMAIRRCEDAGLRTVLIGTFATIVGILVQYQTFSTLYIMNIWVYIGFAMALCHLVPEGSGKAATSIPSIPTK